MCGVSQVVVMLANVATEMNAASMEIQPSVSRHSGQR